ncbi:hypothetical protein GCM10029978_099160 [Actinoallomurus acanthiterrae]
MDRSDRSDPRDLWQSDRSDPWDPWDLCHWDLWDPSHRWLQSRRRHQWIPSFHYDHLDRSDP